MASEILAQGGVYRILNLANGRLYVGSTIRFSRRWKAHLDCLKANRHHSISLQRAWQKYGPASFRFEILECVADFGALLSREQFWINRLKAADPRIGYNISPTAGNCLGVKHGPAVSAAISLRFKGVPKSAEHRARIAAAHRGVPKRYPIFGGKRGGPGGKRNPIPMEVRRKMAAAATLRWTMRGITEETRQKIAQNSRTRPVKDSTREKCRLINLGRVASASTKMKISAANLAQGAYEVLAKSLNDRGLSSPNQKIPPISVEEIIAASKSGERSSSIARRYGVNRSTIYRLVNRRTHTSRPLGTGSINATTPVYALHESGGQ